jgi:hypothetical protein
VTDIAKLHLVKRSKDDLQKLLADSVERASTVKVIDAMLERWHLWPTAVHALRELRETIESGRHVR